MRQFISKLHRVVQYPVELLDQRLSPLSVLALTVLVIFIAFVGSVLITVINAKHYLDSYTWCLYPSCLEVFVSAVGPQLQIIYAGGQVAVFIALVLGPYIALKSYLSTNSAQAFGNSIAHLGFYEKFVQSEIEKRERIKKESVDVFSLYRLMFPESGGSYCSDEFLQRVGSLTKVIGSSNAEFRDRQAKFDFSQHRKRVSEAFSEIFLKVESTPRIDFLETEDQLLDFAFMLVRVFSSPDVKAVEIPVRLYR